VFAGIEALMKQRDWEGAAVQCKALLQLQPINPRAHAYLGLCHFYKSEWETAAGCFSKATALDPNYWEAGAKLAQCLQRQHKYTEAYEVAREWLHVQPNDHTLQGLVDFLAPLAGGRKDGWERTQGMSRHIEFTHGE
jgi:tetratricopeptide (TPR) repeat protein